MINIQIVPPATATEQEMTVEITESICKRMCVNSGTILSGNVEFSAGTPTVVNGVAIVPVTATGVIIINGNYCSSCNTNIKHFVETFEIPFTATTANTVTLTEGSNVVVKYADVDRCHTNKVKLTTTLTATIA